MSIAAVPGDHRRSVIDRKIKDRKIVFGEGRLIFLSSNLSVSSVPVLPTRLEQARATRAKAQVESAHET
jgi:hypothetical protein